jgi:hypothetical protein
MIVMFKRQLKTFYRFCLSNSIGRGTSIDERCSGNLGPHAHIIKLLWAIPGEKLDGRSPTVGLPLCDPFGWDWVNHNSWKIPPAGEVALKLPNAVNLLHSCRHANPLFGLFGCSGTGWIWKVRDRMYRVELPLSCS